ncbi:uncharacterized protein FFB20_15309 [Fusarium fujikuroi]|uniref:Uncharacterized protein n=1 Tax=Fusarium fujikuroi TaxID=5127 RepID=A0A2H3RR09_FUSFU|nr:uncharacterized protein FFE2_00887 [Fusarium fujikuroi]SCN70367.1 uncharacterized protein FFC1_00883 [Fusarium fujikuroi]SCO17550.1 uncharacterized protein FFB20_15309 [Fusarium fujikuroi]SCO29363.1 uncharacterized protein FFNC_00884 [Fusarium fujikuroi]SCV27643.1 uncharacterized protein FFFS_00885 [Fusarium fujikuroi]
MSRPLFECLMWLTSAVCRPSSPMLNLVPDAAMPGRATDDYPNLPLAAWRSIDTAVAMAKRKEDLR